MNQTPKTTMYSIINKNRQHRTALANYQFMEINVLYFENCKIRESSLIWLSSKIKSEKTIWTGKLIPRISGTFTTIWSSNKNKILKHKQRMDYRQV